MSKKWRLNNIYRIVNKEGEQQIFNFNDEQKEIFDNCFDKNGKLHCNPEILKSRQLGITTFFVLNYLDDVITNKNINAVIQSHDTKSLEKIFRIVKNAYKHLPEKFRPELDRGGGSKYEYYFPKMNSRIYVALENRSSTVHRLHLSETAFQDTDKIGATMGALPPHTRYSSETTANGLNFYSDDWNIDKPGRIKFFFAWFMHRLYRLDGIDTGPYTAEEQKLSKEVRASHGITLERAQIEFRRQKIADFKYNGVSMFNQEYPSNENECFTSSGHNFFDIPKINELKLNIKPVLFECENGWRVVEEYVPGKAYIISADTSEGLAKGDFSRGKIIRYDTFEEVAYYGGKPSPSRFAEILFEGANLFGNKLDSPPLMAVERNNHGHAVLLKLDEKFDYWNLYKYAENKLGYLTNLLTRPVMLDSLKEVLEDESFTVNDPDLFNECLTFVEDNGKLQAQKGKNDDAVMATAIAVIIISKRPNIGKFSNSSSVEKKTTLAGALKGGSLRGSNNW